MKILHTVERQRQFSTMDSPSGVLLQSGMAKSPPKPGRANQERPLTPHPPGVGMLKASVSAVGEVNVCVLGRVNGHSFCHVSTQIHPSEEDVALYFSEPCHASGTALMPPTPLQSPTAASCFKGCQHCPHTSLIGPYLLYES